jgi:hypothetical protein
VIGDVHRTANEKTLGDFLVAHHRHISPRLVEPDKLLVFRRVVPSGGVFEYRKANGYDIYWSGAPLVGPRPALLRDTISAP